MLEGGAEFSLSMKGWLAKNIQIIIFTKMSAWWDKDIRHDDRFLLLHRVEGVFLLVLAGLQTIVPQLCEQHKQNQLPL